jgi:hypothetical protein
VESRKGGFEKLKVNLYFLCEEENPAMNDKEREDLVP